MCNLYSHSKNVDAIRKLFDVDEIAAAAGNLPVQASIFPGYEAPVVRQDPRGARELTVMKWGFVLNMAGKAPKHVNNCRDDKAMSSPFWKSSFVERRCLVPATSFAEYHPRERNEKGHKALAWFAIKGDEPRPLFAFAGLWRRYSGNYRGDQASFDTFTVMTTKPNELVKPIHPTRMPVILKPDQFESWFSAPAADALAMARPYPAGEMRIAFIGTNQDPGHDDLASGLAPDLFSR